MTESERIAELRVELDAHQRVKPDCQCDMCVLFGRLDALQYAYDTDVIRERRKADEWAARIADAARVALGLQAQIDASETELRIRTESHATACAEVERLRALLDATFVERDELAEDINEAHVHAVDILGRNANLDGSIAPIVIEIGERLAEVTAARNELQDVAGEMAAKLESAHLFEGVKRGSPVPDASDATQVLAARLNAATAELRGLNYVVDRMDDDIERLRDRLREVEADRDRLQRAVATWEAAVDKEAYRGEIASPYGTSGIGGSAVTQATKRIRARVAAQLAAKAGEEQRDG